MITNEFVSHNAFMSDGGGSTVLGRYEKQSRLTGTCADWVAMQLSHADLHVEVVEDNHKLILGFQTMQQKHSLFPSRN